MKAKYMIKRAFTCLSAIIVLAVCAGCAEKSNPDMTTGDLLTITDVPADEITSALTMEVNNTTETTTITEETEKQFFNSLPGKSLDIITPKVFELAKNENVEEFPNKQGLSKAKELFYNDVFLSDIETVTAHMYQLMIIGMELSAEPKRNIRTESILTN